MAKKTLLIDGDDREHFFLEVESGTIRIGDMHTHAEGIARNLRITRIHCEIEVEDDRDSMAIDEPGVLAPRTLFPGRTVQLGHFHVLLASAPSNEKVAPDPTPATPSISEPTATAIAGQARWLRVVDGANHGRLFRLPAAGTVTVGKSGKNVDIGLDDIYVMRLQCSLDVSADAVLVAPVEGASGTLIDGQSIARPQILRPGHVLRVGNSHLRLEAGVFPEEAAESRRDQPAGKDGSGVLRPGASNPKPPPVPKSDDPLIGREFGPFLVGRLLGRGHSGSVYSATHSKTGQAVALKVLAPEFPASSGEFDRFARELKSLQHIRHANLITPFSGGKAGANCWLARELVEGESADAVIARVAEGHKPSWTRAVRVSIHLARVLDCLHQNHLIHGNITPRNVLLQSSDNAAKLADLRLMQALEGSRLHELFREKKRVAELGYYAPEQVEPDGFVDNLADLYGVGSVAYALIAGRPPATGKTAAEISLQIRTGWAARPSSFYKKVPPEFDGVIMKLLAHHQEDRYQSAQTLLTDLEAIAQQHDITL